MKSLRPLRRLQQKAPWRKPGYVQACLILGKLDQRTQMVAFTEEAWQQIRKDFALPRKPIPAPYTVKRNIGAGDAIAKVATPIARALKMDCIDPATGRLKPDSGCAQRKAALNKIKLPFTS